MRSMIFSVETVATVMAHTLSLTRLFLFAVYLPIIKTAKTTTAPSTTTTSQPTMITTTGSIVEMFGFVVLSSSAMSAVHTKQITEMMHLSKI